MFIDRSVLEISAGKGGDGCVAWRREKYIPKGGPTGGNGGRGGSIIFEADKQLFCLEGYYHTRRLVAENGRPGESNLCQGRSGKDLVLKVPCGTLIKDAETGDIIADLTQDKETYLICKGGKGGLGNDFFKSPTNRAPNTFTKGKPGEARKIELELKLIADIGLVGFPNAGKSTLLSNLANISLKIGAYPFTTLHPNIGVIKYPDGERLFIADIPGIIEGAHNDRGLGLEFLRHIERTTLLIFVLDASGIEGRTAIEDYRTLLSELSLYNPDLVNRPSLIALNKCDTEESVEHIKEFQAAYPKANIFIISALEGTGLPALKAAIMPKAPTL